MTATLVAQLMERGRFGLHTPIGELLPSADVAGLLAVRGVDPGRDVTVDHLLSTTAGLPDFFDPPRGHATGTSRKGMASQPDRYWSPAELLAEVRRLPAVGPPGERFHYTDTAYVLLGRILEASTAETLSELLRSRIFEPCGMASASTPFGDARTPSALEGLEMAPMWLGRAEVSGALSLSLDWTGGGVVATPADFIRFQEALQSGQLISTSLLRHLGGPPVLLPPTGRPRGAQLPCHRRDVPQLPDAPADRPDAGPSRVIDAGGIRRSGARNPGAPRRPHRSAGC